MWDPWFVAHEGEVHLFHLQRLANGSKRTAAEADHIGHAVTRDLIHWTELPVTVGPGEKGGMEDMNPWTGCTIVQGGVFHLFYTMRSTRDASRSNYGGGGIQRIGLATSRDQVHWQRHPNNPVLTPDPRWYVHEGKPEPGNKVGCRDLKIIRDPAGDGWIGFYAQRFRQKRKPRPPVSPLRGRRTSSTGSRGRPPFTRSATAKSRHKMSSHSAENGG